MAIASAAEANVRIPFAMVSWQSRSEGHVLFDGSKRRMYVVTQRKSPDGVACKPRPCRARMKVECKTSEVYASTV